jgi:hypothetical protein
MLIGYMETLPKGEVAGGLGSYERLDFRLETMEPGRTLFRDCARHFVIGHPTRVSGRRPNDR